MPGAPTVPMTPEGEPLVPIMVVELPHITPFIAEAIAAGNVIFPAGIPTTSSLAIHPHLHTLAPSQDFKPTRPFTMPSLDGFSSSIPTPALTATTALSPPTATITSFDLFNILSDDVTATPASSILSAADFAAIQVPGGMDLLTNSLNFDIGNLTAATNNSTTTPQVPQVPIPIPIPGPVAAAAAAPAPAPTPAPANPTPCPANAAPTSASPSVAKATTPAAPAKPTTPAAPAKPTPTHPTDLRCPDCSLTFSRLHGLLRHQRTAHSDHRAFSCDRCDAKFKRFDSLRKHVLANCRKGTVATGGAGGVRRGAAAAATAEAAGRAGAPAALGVVKQKFLPIAAR
ncbi:hypothetical protein HDU96_007186 [Phlyctochytrium bullatum]|nr:hypothetical protein HDU96_007186 [Phlyctochytrium bullatum]